MKTNREILIVINISIILESLGSIIWLFLIPGDPENAFLFGLSLRRLVLLLIPTLWGILNTIILFGKKRGKIDYPFTILENFPSFLLLVLVCIPSLLGLLVWLFTVDGMIRGIMGRLAPILFLVFFTTQ